MSQAKTGPLKGRQNPVIDPGTASNTTKLVLPQNSTANLAQITPEAGMMAYDSTLNQVVYNNGSTFNPIANPGDITSVNAGTGLSGGGTSGDVTLNLANTTVTAGSYTNANLTVDAQGRLTAASNGSGGGGTPGGSNTQIQYNNSGAFGGATNLFFSGNGLVGGTQPSLAGTQPVIGVWTGNNVNGLVIGNTSGAAAGSVVIKSQATYGEIIGARSDLAASTDLRLATSGTLHLGNANHLWPNTDGTANQVLKTDGAGNLSFTTISGSSAAGSTGAVQFNNAGSFAADTSNLFWDNTNKFLGINTNTPTTPLQVKGTASFIAGTTQPNPNLPNPAVSGIYLFGSGTPYNTEFALVRSANTANQRIWDFGMFSDGVLQGRVVNDAFSAATPWITVTGNSSAISSVVFPGSQLNVQGSHVQQNSTQGYQWWKDGTPSKAWTIAPPGFAGFSGNDGSMILATFDGAAWHQRAIVDGSNGFLGLGTNTAPLVPLEINYSASGGANGGGMRMTNTNTGAATWIDLASGVGGAANTRIASEAGVVGSISTTTNHPFEIRTNGTTKMHINATGEVGIGQTSPYSLLSNTSVNTVGSDGNGATPSSTLSWASSVAGYAATIANTQASNGPGLAVQIHDTAALALDISQSATQSSAGTSLLAVRGSGKVGIGTNAPTSPLQVVGLPVFANNAAAISGGLTVGAFYRTGADPDFVAVVH